MAHPSPLKDLRRPQASVTYLTPPPRSSQDSHSRGCQDPRAGLRGHYSPSPLPASHWTYNSGTEPGSGCPPTLGLGDTSPGEPGTPTPDLERRVVGILTFSGSGSGSAFLLLRVPAPPLHLTLPFHISLYFAFLFVALNLSCCLSWVSLAPPWPREEEGVSHPDHPPLSLLLL